MLVSAYVPRRQHLELTYPQLRKIHDAFGNPLPHLFSQTQILKEGFALPMLLLPFRTRRGPR